MGDIIISEYEKMRETRQMVEEESYRRGLFMLIVTILLLVLNQMYTRNLAVQTGLNLVGFVTAFLLFYCQQARRIWKKQTLAEYAGDMECMENVLYCLDIDTYNKLGLVIDEVRARINDDEQERKRKEKISLLGIVALAGMISVVCLYWEKEMVSYVQVGSLLNFFLMIATLLLACVYVGARMYSANRKYKWLYEILLNVMITKF